jgi:hypothetical protein
LRLDVESLSTSWVPATDGSLPMGLHRPPNVGGGVDAGG